MFPLVGGIAHKPMDGWAHIPSNTRFSILVIKSIDEESHTCMGRALIAYENTNFSFSPTWYPLMLKVPPIPSDSIPDLYLKMGNVHDHSSV